MIQPEQIEIPHDPSQTEIITHTLRLWAPPYTLAERRQFLIDAERVGLACANSLIAPL